MDNDNLIQAFHNAEFGDVRILKESEDKYLFCGIDVCNALGYLNSRTTLKRHCRYVSKRYVPHPQTKDKKIEMAFIPEGDLYRLIVHSKLPAAERFEKWIFDELLPVIRKHGAYMSESILEQIQENPECIFTIAEALLKERKNSKHLENKLHTAEPKAAYFDQFVSEEDTTNIRNTAKELGIPQNVFIAFLETNHYVYRDANNKILPYSDYTKKGYFRVRDIYTSSRSMYPQTLITCKGKNHFRLQKEKGKLGDIHGSDKG